MTKDRISGRLGRSPLCSHRKAMRIGSARRKRSVRLGGRKQIQVRLRGRRHDRRREREREKENKRGRERERETDLWLHMRKGKVCEVIQHENIDKP